MIKIEDNYNRIFSHSVAVGLTAQHINRQLKTGFSDDIIVNGMLHDLGYLVLNRYYPETYTTNLMLVMEEKGSLLEAEKEIEELGNTVGDLPFIDGLLR